MAQRNRNDEAPASGSEETVESLGYPAIRKNIPPVGSASHGVVKDVRAMQHAFNPYLAPDLKSPPDAHGVDGLCDRVQWIIAESRARSLESDEADVLSEALRQYQPWLESSGEREKSWIVVNPVASHLHECVSTEAFFPARKTWNQLPKAFHNQERLDASLFDGLCGYRILPLSPAPRRIADTNWKIAIKAINPRRSDGLRVVDGGELK